MWAETLTKTVLENCMRVTSMHSPHARTVSVGLFVDHGVKDEEIRSNGISHFIEHLVFNPIHMEPATRQRLDGLLNRGATYEAFTGKEFTRCTVTCLRPDLETAVECLAGILTKPRILTEGVEHERAIILQEHDTYFSSSRVQEELIEKALWGNRSLGLFVIGTRGNIAGFACNELNDRLNAYYAPQNTQMVVTGNVSSPELIEVVRKHFSTWELSATTWEPVLIEVEPNIIGLPTGGSRADITLAFPAPAFHHGDRYAAELLGDILGGSIKSRLFQEVREKRQLCYAIGAYSVSYRLGGYLPIVVNTQSDQVREVFQTILAVLDEIKQHPVSPDELERARAARITATLELPADAKRHLQVLGRHAMLGRDFFVDWECNELRRVTADDLLRVARTIFTVKDLAISGVGVKGEDLLNLI